MAKKSKSKNSGGNTSNAKNIKALINQNKMVVQQNAEAERRKKEEEEARAKAKLEREEALKAQEAAKAVAADEVISPEGEVVETPAKKQTEKKEADKKEKEKESKQKDLKAKRKADPERRTMKKRIKETMSELKKVSWPSFKDVVKKTGVVLAVVIFFGIVLWIFDIVGQIFYKLLQGQPVFPLF